MISERHMPASQDPPLPGYKMETISGPNGNEVAFSPERGGIITSLKLHGVEALYLDTKTFVDPKVNVRGGVPILFPNAGPLEGERSPYPALKQHGFARTSAWTAERVEGAGWSERLVSDDETKQVFPYDLELRMKGELRDDGSVVLVQEVTNRETDREMPVAMGLHPYFWVSNDKKKDIKFAFPGGKYIEDNVEKWANGEMVSTENPKVNDPDAVLRIEIPGLGTLVMDVSAEYQKIWVWSLPDKDFICIEPVMRNIGGLISDPEMVKPGETLSGRVSLQLEQEVI